MPLIDKHNVDSFFKKIEVDVHEFTRLNPYDSKWETIISDALAKEIDKLIIDKIMKDKIMKDEVHISLKKDQPSLEHGLNEEPWGFLGYMDFPFISKEDATDK